MRSERRTQLAREAQQARHIPPSLLLLHCCSRMCVCSASVSFVFSLCSVPTLLVTLLLPLRLRLLHRRAAGSCSAISLSRSVRWMK
jgi:hypothetical protein